MPIGLDHTLNSQAYRRNTSESVSLRHIVSRRSRRCFAIRRGDTWHEDLVCQNSRGYMLDCAARRQASIVRYCLTCQSAVLGRQPCGLQARAPATLDRTRLSVIQPNDTTRPSISDRNPGIKVVPIIADAKAVPAVTDLDFPLLRRPPRQAGGNLTRGAPPHPAVQQPLNSRPPRAKYPILPAVVRLYPLPA